MPDKKKVAGILVPADAFMYVGIFHDNLSEITRMQQEFMKRFYSSHVHRDESELTPSGSARHGGAVNFLQQSISCIHNEAEEIREWLPWKHWKNYSDEEKILNLEEIRLEYIDLLHFVLEGLIYLGMDGDDIFRYYVCKHLENIRRQKGEYAGGQHPQF